MFSSRISKISWRFNAPWASPWCCSWEPPWSPSSGSSPPAFDLARASQSSWWWRNTAWKASRLRTSLEKENIPSFNVLWINSFWGKNYESFLRSNEVIRIFLMNTNISEILELLADVKIKISVLVLSLKPSIFSSASFQRDETCCKFWVLLHSNQGVKPAIVAHGDGKFRPWSWPQNPSEQNP